MRRGRLFILIALLLILVLAAVFILSGGFGTTQQPDIAQEVPTAAPPPQTVEVVVVTQKVMRGSALNENVVGLVEIPLELQIPGMYTDIAEVLERRAKFDLDSGVVLTSSMITESPEQFSTTGSDAALLIPPGKVAVSIPINRLSSVSYGPQRGDHVNVIVTLLMVDLDADNQSVLPNSAGAVIAPGPSGAEGGPPIFLTNQLVNSEGVVVGRLERVEDIGGTEEEPGSFFYIIPSEPQRPRLVSQTLIQDAIVLQVGDFPLPEELVAPTPTPAVDEFQEEQGGVDTGEGAPVATPPPPPPAPDLITLIVSPQDAVTLNYLIYSGAQLTMALRSATDTSLTQTEAVTLQYLLDVYSIPVPVKLPFGLEPRVDALVPPELPNDLATPTPVP
jgi:pilus assembly protein CpaB